MSLTSKMLATTALTAALSLASFAASAASCGSGMQSAIQQAAAQKQQTAAQQADKNYKGIVDQPEQISDSNGLLSGCVDQNWPSGGFKMPTIAKVIEKAKKSAIKRGCSEARKEMSSVNSQLGRITGSVQQYQTQIGGLTEDPFGAGSTGGSGWGSIGGSFGGGTGTGGTGTGGTGTGGTGGGIPGITPGGGSGGVPGVTP